MLIPCTKRKLPASVQVHFNTTTTITITITTTTTNYTHSLCIKIDPTLKLSTKKLSKILKAADNYTVLREAHCVSNIRWVAIDSGAASNSYLSDYKGGNHIPLALKVIVGCANYAAIKSKAQDTIRFKNLPTEAKICHKFDEITTPLLSVSQLCKNKMTVTYNKKGVLENNSECETVICIHLYLGNTLYMVPADNTHAPTAPNETPRKTRNIVELSQHRASIAYSIKCVPKLIKYLHTAIGFPVKERWIAAIAKGWYITWPGLTVNRVNKYLDPSEHTTMGHMKIQMKICPTNKSQYHTNTI